MPTADSLASSATLRADYQAALAIAASAQAAAAKAAAARQAAQTAIKADDAAAAASVAQTKAATVAVSNMTYSQADAAGIDHGIIRAAQSYVTGSQDFPAPPVVTVTPTPITITATGDTSGATGSSSQNTGNASITIKLATDNLLAFKPDTIDAEATANMLFQSIGGIELLEYSRSDMIYNIDNQALPYQVFSDLSALQSKYSPKSLSGLQDAIGDSLTAFPLDISKYIPLVPTRAFYVYVEDNVASANLDNLIIEVIGITDKSSETVQVEVMNSSEVYSY
jgi:hypothetical protein